MSELLISKFNIEKITSQILLNLRPRTQKHNKELISILTTIMYVLTMFMYSKNEVLKLD